MPINSGWLLLGKTEDVDCRLIALFCEVLKCVCMDFGGHLNRFSDFDFFFSNAKLEAWGENLNSVPKEMKQNVKKPSDASVLLTMSIYAVNTQRAILRFKADTLITALDEVFPPLCFYWFCFLFFHDFLDLLLHFSFSTNSTVAVLLVLSSCANSTAMVHQETCRTIIISILKKWLYATINGEPMSLYSWQV